MNAKYRPYAFGGAGEITTELGRFEGVPGEPYRLALRIGNIASELMTAHLRLKVEAPWAAWGQWEILKQVGFLAAILFCATGLICISAGKSKVSV